MLLNLLKTPIQKNLKQNRRQNRLGLNTPYNKVKIARKYATYYLNADTKHKVHSPLVYALVTDVLKKTNQSKNKEIESERKRLLSSKQTIDFKDFGKSGTLFKRNISEIAKSSLKSKKYAKLLSQLVKHYKCKNILELGTSLGITTSYFASNKDTQVITLEGDQSVHEIAKGIWNQLGYTNITSLVGEFDLNLDKIPDHKYDLIYIDGNHSYEPTIRYYKELLKKSHDQTIFVFDDIHYSKGMEKAWKEIQKHETTSISIDLFFLGIVFIDPTLSQQQFTLKY
ncbi:MAG: class I SAM-dependent methyltransferase [Bacteroidia bacterium]|nr:class I SAM-dependent methyltransferase [Bacteroidia bacterium]